MPRSATPLVLLALLAIGVAIAAGLAGQNAAAPAPDADRGAAPVGRTLDSSTSAGTRDRVRAGGPHWTPASYRASWERQIALAGGRYRRDLRAQRPGAAEIGALRADQARSEARLRDARRDPDVSAPAARVLVTLEEETVAAGQTIAGPTVNQIDLRRSSGRWRVVAFTAISGGATPGSGA